MMALVWGGTLNSSAANFRTAVNGAPSGTLNLDFTEPETNKMLDRDIFIFEFNVAAKFYNVGPRHV